MYVNLDVCACVFGMAVYVAVCACVFGTAVYVDIAVSTCEFFV